MRAWLNVFLMAMICAIFIVFMALRPAQAGRMLLTGDYCKLDLPTVADDEELFERVRETTSSVRS